MKSLFRWSATLGIVSSAVLWIGQTMTALALPPEQIIQKLGPIPVFTIADEQGAPLVKTGEDNLKTAGVFISQQDAQNFVAQLKQENPDLGGKVQVVPVSLGEIYELQKQNATNAEGLKFAFVPEKSEVDSAKTVLSENGQEYLGGVPLFVARGGDQGYLTIQQNEQEVIPFFFEKEQLESMLTQFKQDKPELASTIKIEVIPLESIIATLEESDDEMLTKIILWPSQEAIDFVRSSQTEAQPSPTETKPNQ